MNPRKLNILIAALGSRGDLHPMLGIGVALRARGHDVRFLINEYDDAMIRRGGFESDHVGSANEHRRLLSHPDLWDPWRSGELLYKAAAIDTMPAVFDAIATRFVPDQTVVLATTLAIGARVAHEALSVPLATVHASPAPFKWLAHSEIDDAMWDAKLADPINAFRANHKLAPVSRVMSRWWNSPQCIIGTFPGWFAPPEPWWPAHAHATGFPLYDAADAAQMSPQLEAFLAAGEAPIVFSPSASMREGDAFFRAAIEACQLLNRRGLLLTSHREQVPRDLPPNMAHFDYAPFSMLLPRCAAIVHQGGIGTIALALAAAIPHVAIPVAHDQLANSESLAKLGVAGLLNPDEASARRIATALGELMGNPKVESRAKQLAQRVQTARPLEKIVELTESLAARAGTRGNIARMSSGKSKRNVLFVTYGTQGDINPHVGMGVALKERGHQVTLATNSYFESFVRGAGLDFVSIGTEAAFREAVSNQRMWNPEHATEWGITQSINPMIRPVLDVIAQRRDGLDVVVASTLSIGAIVARDAFGIPTVSVHLYPEAFEHPKIHDGVAPPLNALRRELGLAPVTSVTEWWHSPDRVLCTFPEWFAQPGPDWPPQARLVGFPFYDGEAHQPLSEDLARWLDEGDAPIIFNPGSAMWDAQKFFHAAADACEMLGRRGVFITRKRSDLPDRLPTCVYHTEYAPLTKLMARSAAIVYHGGIGTAGLALAAGIPHLVMPMAYDQPGNAARLERLGVGRSLLPAEFDSRNVAARLQLLLTDPAIKMKCAEIAKLSEGDAPRQRGADYIEEAAALTKTAPIVKHEPTPLSRPPKEPTGVKVSALIVSYNQERYIEQAVRSALMQQTDFDYEIVVSDDCSTDGTQEILRRLQAEYPERLRVFINEKNVGMHLNYRQSFARCRGQYMAMLEGDDYWTSPHKLQKQVEFLDSHPECILCFHDVMVFVEGTGIETPYRAPQKEITGFDEILEDIYINTGSVMLRLDKFPGFPEWGKELLVGDWPFFIYLSMLGKFGYINEMMGAYRKHPEGTWQRSNVAGRVAAVWKMYDYINHYFKLKYDKQIQLLKRRWEAQLHMQDDLANYILKLKSANERIEQLEKEKRALKKRLRAIEGEVSTERPLEHTR